MTIIGLLLVLVVIGVGLYLVSLIPMDPTIRKIIVAVVLLAVVLWLLESFAVVGPFRMTR